MSDSLIRTFISIPVPNEVKSKKNMLYSTLENSPANISWVKNEQLHLTLKFLGHTPETIIENIKSEISKISSTVKPFKLLIDKTGCFPKRERPRVLWLGVRGNISALNDLFLRIDKKMNKIGFPCLDKEFIPHITLARVKYPQKHTPDISTFLKSSYDPIDFTADRVQFLTSELLPSGTFYTLLGSFPLGESL
tara:strand:- start:90 stop:668 length:579 start_codon:yes stop_codon:yes gene_type:complete